MSCIGLGWGWLRRVRERSEKGLAWGGWKGQGYGGKDSSSGPPLWRHREEGEQGTLGDGKGDCVRSGGVAHGQSSLPADG